jgi:hypothetical protein
MRLIAYALPQAIYMLTLMRTKAPCTERRGLCLAVSCFADSEAKPWIDRRVKLTMNPSKLSMLLRAVVDHDTTDISQPASNSTSSSLPCLVFPLIGDDEAVNMSATIAPSSGGVMVVADICGGKNDVICQYFSELSGVRCITNDIQRSVAADSYLDATSSTFVEDFHYSLPETSAVDWVITSPPYGEHAAKCVANALLLARQGVAMKVRLTFLEPCQDRRDLLEEHPVDLVIPLFRTDSRDYDSVCEAWFIRYISPRLLSYPGGKDPEGFVYNYYQKIIETLYQLKD